MKSKLGHVTSLIFCGLVLLSASRAPALTLIENGKSGARIMVVTNAPAEVKNAADELSRVLELMSGAKLSVEQLPDTKSFRRDVPGIVLGSLAEAAGVKTEEVSRARDGFRYKVAGHQLLIVGESPSGVYTGAIRWLESLGCGWYVPGDVGEVIPRKTTVAVDDATDAAGLSDSIHRRFWYGGQSQPSPESPTGVWLQRNNGGGIMRGGWGHAYGGLIPKEVKDQHPEYGSLNRGQRTFKQLCTSNPGVVRTAAETLKNAMKGSSSLIFGAGPNDGGNLCECDECAKLGTPGYFEPSSGKPACSDRIFQFASDVAAITSKTFPDCDLGVYVYSEYSRIPLKIKKLDDNVFPMIAPIRRCRIHGPGNPNCEMALLLQEEIRGWGKLTRKLGFYPYNYNLADTLLPFTKFDYYRRLVKEVNEAKIEQLAWDFETIDSWSMMAPSLYLSVRVSWNVDIDVDAELDRFYIGFYGAAADPMKRYWSRIDEAYATIPSHSGSSYGMHKYWTPELLKESRADIKQAVAKASNQREKEAVAMAEAGLRCAELYMGIWNAVSKFDSAAAGKIQAQLGDHVAFMASKGGAPRWAHNIYAFDRYYKRFVGLTVDGGSAIMSAGGRIAAKLPEEWSFRTDEQGVGVAEGWYGSDLATNGWRSIGTMQTCWADEGLTWYKGDAWYRTSFDVPAEFKGTDLRLWFGGFDYNVDVYLNGNHLGEKTGFAMPREFEGVADKLHFDKPNVLAVRVSAGDLAEIGTGGIMMPVMIYTPGASPASDKQGSGDKTPAYEM